MVAFGVAAFLRGIQKEKSELPTDGIPTSTITTRSIDSSTGSTLLQLLRWLGHSGECRQEIPTLKLLSPFHHTDHSVIPCLSSRTIA